MTRYIPPSIEDIGLEKHLDVDKAAHNGNGYREFKNMHEAEASITTIARKFRVDRKTVLKWVAVYEKQLADQP